MVPVQVLDSAIAKSGIGTEGCVGVTSGVTASGSGANAAYVRDEPTANRIANDETKTESRLSFFLRKALLASNSCFAANFARRSRSNDFPVADLVKVSQLPLIGFQGEFTKLLHSFLIALWL